MDNLPDAQAASAAQDVLQLARGAGRGEVLLVLMSGGGSALLPCPVEGVSLEEKRTVGVSVRVYEGEVIHFGVLTVYD